jgi:hypothetical protein
MAKTKVNLSANEISDKWNKNMKSSVSYIQAGIDKVTENPAEKAIAKQDKMIQNLTQSVNSGKWAAGLRGVSLADWKQQTKEKVGSRLASGVDGAMSKRQKFDAYLVNTLNGVLPEVANMPDMTIEDSVNKVRRVMEHMHNNPYKK